MKGRLFGINNQFRGRKANQSIKEEKALDNKIEVYQS